MKFFHSSTKTIPKLYLNKFNEKKLNHLPTNELFTKFGFLNNPKPGLVHWLPIGLLMLNKLKAVINKRLQEINAEQVSLSILSHSKLWQLTNRWNNTELFKLTDSSDQQYCLSATSEEDVTNLVKQNLTSYKDLPIIYYQIHEKFRDEIRPRMGLLRSREFLMKDAYSFDVDEQLAFASYNTMVHVYHNIFNDLRLPYVKAVADSGDIGGSLSHEWHYLHDSGEDSLLMCDNKECNHVSNVEKTLSEPKLIDTNIPTDTIYVRSKQHQYYKVVYPTDRDFDLNLLKVSYPDVVEVVSTLPEGLDNVPTVFDTRVSKTGTPVVSAEEGEICYQCHKGQLSTHRAIEVGHTFYLGDKYSKPLQLTIPIPSRISGETQVPLVNQPLVMGCYGIGISRIIASIGEITRDSKGFKWPRVISPWDVTVIESSGLTEDCQKFYQMLNDHRVDYRLDNRDSTNLGKKINQSNMIGIPLVIILGKSYPLIEVEVRGNRYNEKECQWENLYNTRDFEWQVFREPMEKHLVHKDGLVRVVEALLHDM